MSDPNRTVFISYRRKVSSFIARAIFQDLRVNDYDVFMDVESIDSGTFDTIILNQIAARAHFLIILTPGTLNRCIQPGDWLRREIEYAMEQQRNIVPVLVNDFKFGSKVNKYLTGQLESLSRLNSLPLPHEYFDEGMERLRKRFLKRPVVGAVLIPTPLAEQLIVEQKIEEAASQPRPSEVELSAEEYFVRAYEKYETGDLDGAIEDYTEAIRLNSEYLYAYNNRGVARYDQKDLNGAIDDYDRAIMLNADYVDAYNNRGSARYQQEDITGALADFDKAIALNPDYAKVYNNRGLLRYKAGDTAGALTDFDKTIAINPNYAKAYNNRGLLRYEKGDLIGALIDCDMAITLIPDYADAFYNRGNVRLKQKDVSGGIADYDKAIELNPHHPKAYNNRGNVRLKQGNMVGAIADYDKALELNPNDSNMICNRAEAHFALRHYESALAEFKRSNELKSGNLMVIGGLAITHHAMAQVDEAKHLWQGLVNQDERYRDAEWVRKELNWAEPLVEEARKLIASL